jgi:hypothetical protein
MSAEERGLYRDALDLCYAEGSIPADETTLQRLLAVSSDEFDRSWPRVSSKFEPHPTITGRLINPKAKDVLDEQEVYRRKQSEFGKKGGRPKTEGSGKGSQKGSLSESKRVAKGNPLFLEKPNTSSKEEVGEEIAHHSMSVWGELFAQWWETYPRKISKLDAQKAYREIVVEGKAKQPEQRADLKPYPNFADRHAQLVTATKRWTAGEFSKREVDKIPYPATYLRRLDWLSAPEGPAKRGPETDSEVRERLAATPPPAMSWESRETYQDRMRREGYAQ